MNVSQNIVNAHWVASGYQPSPVVVGKNNWHPSYNDLTTDLVVSPRPNE